MWLPKEERRLLQGYYLKINEVNKEKWFHISEWITVIGSLFVKRNVKKVKDYYEGDSTKNKDRHPESDDTLKKEIVTVLQGQKIIATANKMLEARGLIKLREHQHAVNVVGITLTLDGYNTGNKYGSSWQWIKLWYEEYIKNHPIWLIVSYIAGIISMLLVNWLSK